MNLVARGAREQMNLNIRKNSNLKVMLFGRFDWSECEKEFLGLTRREVTRSLIGHFQIEKRRTLIGQQIEKFPIGYVVMKWKRGLIVSSLLIGGRISGILIGRANRPMGEQYGLGSAEQKIFQNRKFFSVWFFSLVIDADKI